jgi:hypothetical protein
MSRTFIWTLNKRLRVVLDEHRHPWLLCLYIPVRFSFIGWDGKEIAADSWDKSVYKWRDEFKRLVERTFSFQYRIEATKVSATYARPNSGMVRDLFGLKRPALLPRQRPLPSVKVQIVVRDITKMAAKNLGIKLTVVPGYDDGSGAGVTSQNLQRVHVRASAITYNYQNSQGKVETRKQRPAVHEMGHIMGLDHPVCPGNEARCYGAKGTAAHAGIMGMGMTVQPRNYHPFVRFMNERVSQYHWSLRLR